MRLIDLTEEIRDAYESAMQMVKREDEMLVSYGTRHATRLLLEELGKVYMSCTQDEQPLREMYGNLIMGIALDWRDVYERNCYRDFEEDPSADERALPIHTLQALAYALLAK
nr:MAG TPA: hypothetical protein [Caudoviricetes sp.]